MQLFLSFNSADRASGIAVQKLLQARDISTFLDRDNLVSGLAWPQALEQALKAVDGVAVFIGCELGGWQKRKMWLALDRQAREEKEGRAFPVIPVLLQGADLTPGFLFLNTWIDLRREFDSVFTAEALTLSSAPSRPQSLSGTVRIQPRGWRNATTDSEPALSGGRRPRFREDHPFTPVPARRAEGRREVSLHHLVGNQGRTH
jgi:hypothetical protein